MFILDFCTYVYIDIYNSICRVGPIIALTLIAIGTGGIKPCVSTFGADQISMSNVIYFMN